MILCSALLKQPRPLASSRRGTARAGSGKRRASILVKIEQLLLKAKGAAPRPFSSAGFQHGPPVGDDAVEARGAENETPMRTAPAAPASEREGKNAETNSSAPTTQEAKNRQNAILQDKLHGGI